MHVRKVAMFYFIMILELLKSQTSPMATLTWSCCWGRWRLGCGSAASCPPAYAASTSSRLLGESSTIESFLRFWIAAATYMACEVHVCTFSCVCVRVFVCSCMYVRSAKNK